MTSRIDLHLPSSLERKVARVQARTGKSLTAIVIEALERYCDEVLAVPKAPSERLAASRFIGCADGPEDLSETCKQELTRSLDRKG